MVRTPCAVVVVVVLTAAAGSLPARAAEPPPPSATAPAKLFTIAKDTTHATGPLRADGTVDYVAALNEHMAAGVTPENNAAVALLRVMGPKALRMDAEPLRRVWPMLGIEPLPGEGAYYIPPELYVPPERFAGQGVDLREQIDSIHLKPWKAADQPVLAEWVKSQDAAITRIAESTRLPRLYLPFVSKGEPATLFSASGLGAAGFRDAANALGHRARFRLGSGDFDGFREDVAAVVRLAPLVRQRLTLIDQLVAAGIDAQATAMLTAAATSEHVDASQARRLTADLDARPAPASAAPGIDLGERYMMLDFVGLAARHGWVKAATMLGNRGGQRMTFAGKQNRDWDAVLRKVNRNYDRIVEVLEAPTLAERRKKAAALDREQEEFRVKLHSPLGVFAPPEDRFLSLLSVPLLSAVNTPQRLTVERDLARVALALAAHKADRGAYPKALAELAPAYLPKLPLDGFAEGDRPFAYALNGAGGYGLASVGQDGKDSRVDGPLDWRGGDIVIYGGPQPKRPEADEPPEGKGAFPEGGVPPE